MTQASDDAIRNSVRDHYGKVAAIGAEAGCAPGCCGGSAPDQSRALGYSERDVAAGARGNMGLGCGNPLAIAALRPGDTVLDLGSGGGFDCFLAAKQVGPDGRVIGVDMTPAMVTKARENARAVDATNVDFRLGEIEHLPVAEGSVDVVLSNCVVNLSPDKSAVFAEAFRVLKAGGRLAISDVVATGPIPEALLASAESLSACIGGAASVDQIRTLLYASGFQDVRVQVKPESRAFIAQWMPGSGAEDVLASATIEASKPAAKRACCGPACCTLGAST